MPGIVFYNAGKDVLESDPLGGLRVGFERVILRDRFVIGALRAFGVPTVIMASGGYAKQSYHIIAGLAGTVLSVAR